MSVFREMKPTCAAQWQPHPLKSYMYCDNVTTMTMTKVTVTGDFYVSVASLRMQSATEKTARKTGVNISTPVFRHRFMSRVSMTLVIRRLSSPVFSDSAATLHRCLTKLI